MHIGQMAFNRKTDLSDYVQLDMCGIDLLAAKEKFKSIPAGTKVILHGDWTKKGASENDIVKEERITDYIQIISFVKSLFDLIAITIHPPFKSKVSLDQFLNITKRISNETTVPIFIENRSSHKIHFSEPKEVVELTKLSLATIDIPQLYISCGYDEKLFYDTLSELNWENVKEIHLANLKKDGVRSYVGRKLDDPDGVIDIEKVVRLIKKQTSPYYTLEILGGVPTFEKQSIYLKQLL